MLRKYDFFSEALTRLRKESRFRKRQPVVPITPAYIRYEGEKMLSFCSHDYLGLADHPDTKKNAIKYLLQHGITASSECKEFYLSCQQDLEDKLSTLMEREATLFYSSRYEASASALTTLTRPNMRIFIDEHSHPSLINGAKNSEGWIQFYPHKRYDRLEQLLEDAKGQPKIIVSESVFSYSGDVASLSTLIELADHFDALLFIDDSHGFGVTGVDGMGLAAEMGEIDVVTGSLSKACGAYGGYVSCSHLIRDYLVNCAPEYTSHLFPPSIIGAIDAALEMIPQMEGERKQLHQRSHWLRKQLEDIGLPPMKAPTPLISIPMNTLEEARDLRDHLKEEGIFLGPPRVLDGGEIRINLAINVSHTPDLLTVLVSSIKGWLAMQALTEAPVR